MINVRTASGSDPVDRQLLRARAEAFTNNNNHHNLKLTSPPGRYRSLF